MGPDGAAALAPSVRELVHLQTLQLASKEPSPHFAQLALRCSPFVPRRGITGNDMGTKGATAFAASLPYLNHLQTLDMRCEYIRAGDAVAESYGCACIF